MIVRMMCVMTVGMGVRLPWVDMLVRVLGFATGMRMVVMRIIVRVLMGMGNRLMGMRVRMINHRNTSFH